jgi:hypothetical protein
LGPDIFRNVLPTSDNTAVTFSVSDSSINNSVIYDQTNLPAGGLGGDTTSAMTGGGILCDGATPAATSPLRSFVVD